MLEQLTELVKQFGNESVVKNTAIPNEQNDAVMELAGSSIIDGLKKLATSGNISELAGLFQGNNAGNAANPVVQKLTQEFSGNLSEKLGLNSSTATDLAGSLIPKVLGSLIGNAKDSKNSGIQITDIIGAITGGNSSATGGLMDAISKYGGAFGLDQNGDGKVGIDDAIAAVTKKSGGLGGLLGSFFGKKK